MKMDSVVLFPHCTWADFPYKPIIEALGRSHSVYFVSNVSDHSELPTNIQTLSIHDLDTHTWNSTMVIVTHPCWIYEVTARAPAVTAFLLPSKLEQGDEAFLHCRDRLCAAATLVVTGSEHFYFEQSFKRSLVFIQDGHDTAADWLAFAAVIDAAHGRSVKTLAKLQLQRRAEHHLEQLEQQPAEKPEPLFFQSVYYYLLGASEQAEKYGVAAFERAILLHDEQALSTYFRFLSAVRMLGGRLDDGLDTYAVSAVSDSEQADYAMMKDWQKKNLPKLAAASLYRLNDDYKQAAEILEEIQQELSENGLRHIGEHDALQSETEAPNIDIPLLLQKVHSMLAEIYLKCGNVKKAHSLLQSLQVRSIPEKKESRLIEGSLHALEGNRHAAIHAWLQAAMYQAESLLQIAEIAAVDLAAKKLAEGVYP